MALSGVGMIRAQTDSEPEVLAGEFSFTKLIQHASQIEVRQGIAGIKTNGASKALGSVFQVAIFIKERSTIEQYVDSLWVGL